MSDVVFVDTNVLVYARDLTEPSKQPIAAEWMQRLWQERRGRLSVQVLQEYYVTVTRKLKPGLTDDAARADIRYLQAWDPVVTDAALLEAAWALETKHRLSFWDAMIVAAAQRVNARYLLSEDMQDGQAFGEMTILNPFR
jgi:predicted nucleic acid-binding protein